MIAEKLWRRRPTLRFESFKEIGHGLWVLAGFVEDYGADLIGREVSWREAAAAMTQGFAEALNLNFQEAPLTSAEESQAASLRAEVYAAPAWTNKL